MKDFSDAPLQTNNQMLSLTDQLNLGVRSLELDTHWASERAAGVLAHVPGAVEQDGTCGTVAGTAPSS